MWAQIGPAASPVPSVSIPSDVSLADAAIVALVFLYIVDDVRRGFLAGLLDLAGVAVGLIAAIVLYGPVAQVLVERVHLAYALAKPAAFGLVWLASDVVLAATLRRALWSQIVAAAGSPAGRLAGVITGAARGFVVVTLLIGVLSALPLPDRVTDELRSSRLAPLLGDWVTRSQTAATGILGDAVQETIGLLTVRPDSGERVSLPFRVESAQYDATAESRMLDLVNDERTKTGAPAVTMDPAIRDVARAYARQMFAEGIFAHIDPSGRSPFERMRAGGVKFSAAGENLALAPNVNVAHDGLMNSPGHRANILNPRYRRIGIWAADGGLHGKIFTQNFAD